DLEDINDLQVTRIFNGAYDDEVKSVVVDFNNLELTTVVSPIPISRIYKDHPKDYIKKQRRTNYKDYQKCLFSCFLSQIEPKKVTQALTDPNWIEAMKDEFLQFRLQKVWRLVDLPNGKHAIRTKWVYRNKKDDREIVVRNKARMVAQGYTQEEGINYDEVFALVARIEAISFEDPQFPNKVYKVEKALYGLYQALRAWFETLSTYLLENEFRRGIIDKTLFIKKDKGDILLVQVYVDDIIFGSTKKSLCTEFEVKTTSTPIETNKALLKDKEAEDVDVYLYRSKIGSLMYLTASRSDIMLAVYACARDSPFDLEAFLDSDYAGASLDRKSTTKDGNAEFHQIVDFLTTSPIHYALTVSPTIYASYIEQFWATAKSKTVNDVKQIHATVDGKTVVISESSVRSDLHFNDEDGITCLTNTAIFENLALMGYESDSDKLTFQKALFSPQWKYLIHTILHCLSSKSTSWNEFSTNIASAVICLATGQKFNFSKLIFDEPFNDTYATPKHTKNVFTNMKRKEKDFSRRVTPLFASMLALPVVGGEGLGQPSEPQPPSSTTQLIIKEQIPTSVPIPIIVDETVFKERDDKVVRATITAASLDAAQTYGDKPRCQEAIRVPLLKLGMKLFKIGTSRRKGLDKDIFKQGRESDKTKPMFKDSDFDVLDDAMKNVEGGSTDEQIATTEDTLNIASINVSATGPSKSTARDIFEDKMTTIADTLVAIRSVRPRTTSVVICNVKEELRRATSVPTVQSQDKGKGKMVEPERTPKDPRKAQIQMDEELAQRLFKEEQAQFEREQRIARERVVEQ
ncbi:retrovirus-related pol polyprotein from transposon TNT 1-94, partial [Tanacetum coccineum]